MTIRLRGHHLLCLLGFRGMGYSDDFCTNMRIIYDQLRTEPDTEIELIEGPDDICKAYPPDKPGHCEGPVYALDGNVLKQLGLAVGSKDSWRRMCETIADRVAPEDIAVLCVTCPWERYGVCREGVGLIAAGQPLPKLGS